MEEVLLGIDYGTTNTGLAFGRVGLATPLKIVNSKNEEQLIGDIARVVAENHITKVIMGLPLTPEGKDTSQSLKTRQFSKKLKIRVKKPVEFVSEHGTSVQSMQTAIKSGISQKRRHTNDDLSAALILKRYYNQKEEK